MPKVIFHGTTIDGNIVLGELEYDIEAKELLVDDTIEKEAEHLLKGASSPTEVLMRMQRAPIVFDGAYLRAEYIP